MIAPEPGTRPLDSQVIVELAELQERGEEILHRAHELAGETEKQLQSLTDEP